MNPLLERRTFLTRRHFLRGLGATVAMRLLGAEADGKSRTILRQRWRARVDLHSPTNVVVGRLGNEARFCIQGTRHDQSRRSAGIELLDAHGWRIWRDERSASDLDYQAGAYVHWISGPDIAEPMIIYSFVPVSDGHRGGARLVRARDGSLVKEIENTGRFGNDNSIIADLDGDGHTKLLYADIQTLTCYALPSVERLWRWDEGVRFCWSLPALVDVDGDGRREIVFGSEYNNRDNSSSMIALDSRGRMLWRSDGHAEDLGSTPVFAADVDGDGAPELLKVGLDLEHRQKLQWNHLHVFDLHGKLKRKIELGFTGIAIGDMDCDGHLEGVGLTNTRDGGSNGRREIRCLDLATGVVKWTTPVPRAYLDTCSPLMTDFDGSGKLHAVVGTGNPAGYAHLPNSEPWGDLYVVDHEGRIAQHESLPGWPVNLAFCDVDDNGRGELMVVLDGTPGSLALYDTPARTPRKDWPTPFGNAARSGTMSVPARNQ
ncbi:MAG: VCBS repeat-containing protein [Verrucomicrobia bacterium]|nr:VCBS repeat-containing protein [Verrucomicrobiota bacterium]